MHDLTRGVKRLALAYCSSILSIFLLGARSVNAQAPQQSAPQTAQGPSTPPAPNARPAAPALLPLPPGVRELKLSDFFKFPVGRLGPEITDQAKELDGARVRILGFMVRQTEPWAGAFLLAPVPVQLHEEDFGQADDLPASTLYVRMPGRNDPAPFTPGPLLITGTLHVGAREIENDRRTWFTLDLDPIAGPADFPAAVSPKFSETAVSHPESTTEERKER